MLSSKFFSRVLKKKGPQKFFTGDLKKQNQKISKKTSFSTKNDLQILRIPKILLSSSRGQGNFRGLEASRPRTSNVSLRTPPL